MRRVFACPASGALANTMIIDFRQPVGMRAEEVQQAQPPHQQHGAQHAARFPAPPGGEHGRAQARGRGVLYVTPHLGNWELGGAFLTQRGCKLLVLTQAEPDHELTAMREAARARLGVDTLVVGQDAFAFVEVIKRLQAGEHVALLVDRPPAATAVTVELFGQPFPASIAAAELARATGCGIVPVIIVRAGDGYAAEVLPEVSYDR